MKTTKLGYAAILALLLVLASPPGGRSENIITQSTLSEFHDFLGDNGKTFRGRALAYNPDNGTVTIAKEKEKTFSVSLDTLSEADQDYIREWHLIKEFFTQIHCQISPHEKTERSWDGITDLAPRGRNRLQHHAGESKRLRHE